MIANCKQNLMEKMSKLANFAPAKFAELAN